MAIYFNIYVKSSREISHFQVVGKHRVSKKIKTRHAAGFRRGQKNLLHYYGQGSGPQTGGIPII